MKKGRKKVNDISDRTRRDPANFLAIGRTIMANERTLLAFLMLENDRVDPIIGCDSIRNKIEDAVQLLPNRRNLLWRIISSCLRITDI